MTDHQKLLCMLLSDDNDRGPEGVREMVSPLRLVAILLDRGDVARRAVR